MDEYYSFSDEDNDDDEVTASERPTHHATTTAADMAVTDEEVFAAAARDRRGRVLTLEWSPDQWFDLYSQHCARQQTTRSGAMYTNGPPRNLTSAEDSIYYRRKYNQDFNIRECRRCGNAARYSELFDETFKERVVAQLCDVCRRFEYYADYDLPPPHPRSVYFQQVPALSTQKRCKVVRCRHQLRPPLRPRMSSCQFPALPSRPAPSPPPLPPPPPRPSLDLSALLCPA